MRVLLFLLFLANVVVCIGLLRSHFYTRPQMLMQVALVWLFPLLGVVLVGVFLWTQYAQLGRSSEFAPDSWENWQNPTHHDD